MLTTRVISRLRTLAGPALLAALLVSAGSLRATVIDTFEDPGDYALTPDGNAVAFGSLAPGQDGGNALHTEYDLGTGNFIVLSRDVIGVDFLEGANGVAFSYRATGPSNILELTFMDQDSESVDNRDRIVHKRTLRTDNVWREVFLPFSDFLTFPNGDASFDINHVTLMKFGVVKRNGNTGPGELFMDDVRLAFRRDFTTVIDRFESGTFVAGVSQNARELDLTFFAGGATGSGTAVYVTSQAASGSRALELNYAVPAAGFAGVEENLGGLVVPSETDRFVFAAKGAAGGEPLLIELESSAGTLQVSLASYGALTTTYQTFSIPIEDFLGPLDLNALNKVKFLVGDNAGTGTIYIDDVVLAPDGSGTDADGQVVEDFQLDKPLTNFSQSAGISSAEVTLDMVKDPTAPGAADDNRAGRLGYDFQDPTSALSFAVAERALLPNLYAEPVVRFHFKGDGAANNLEFKLVDLDGTTYVRKFNGVTDTNGAWRTASINVDDFAFATAGAGDNTLDLKNIAGIEFAVSRAATGGGSEGTLTLDELETVTPVAFEKPGVGSVLQRVATPNNPFSPNGDGVQDTAKFEYTLAQTARVLLKVYDLRGAPLKTFDMGDLTAGDHVIEWDGVADDGRRVSNGVYLFRLEADGANGPTDVFKEIIGALR